MRAYTEPGFQMLGMHQQACKVIPIRIQTEKNAYSYIINSPFHGTIHRFGMIGIVAFRAGGVEIFVVFFVVGFLK